MRRYGMLDYEAINKKDWFIQKMRSGWFSYQEIVAEAEAEFPQIPRKRLEGTIGQYYSDCVNEKWTTPLKAIRERGLRVVEANDRRLIVKDGGAFTSTAANDAISTQEALPDDPVRTVTDAFLEADGVKTEADAMRESIKAALQRNRTYKRQVADHRRKEFRTEWARLIREESQRYI